MQVDTNSVDTDPTSWANTYMLYDEFGQVVFVIPPEGTKALSEQGSGSKTLTQPIRENWCFQYQYDQRRRVSHKWIPGTSEWTRILYNKLDQVVLTQDPERRTEDKWLYTKYDGLGRPIETGLLTDSRDTTLIQADIDAAYSLFEARAANPEGYTNLAFPTSTSRETHSLTYYDDYDFDRDGSADRSYHPEPTIDNTSNLRARGQVTAVKTLVLEDTTYLWTVSFYDEYYREIQTQSDHLHGTDTLTTELNFAGEVLQTIHRHSGLSASGGPGGTDPVNVFKAYCYDHTGRLLRLTQQVNTDPLVIVGAYDYDALGRQEQKKLHSVDGGSSYLQSVDYSYNIRDWMTGINETAESTDLFELGLIYETGFQSGPAQYNGNISGMSWKTALDSETHGYAYSYDGMNRLIEAEYHTYTSSWTYQANTFDTEYSYDLNGNIETLKRYGLILSMPETYGLLDDLSYSYKQSNGSNQLAAVTDMGLMTGLTGVDQFVDGNMIGDDYFYDGNGNLAKDLNKGIDTIRYNHLNKPIEISFNGGEKIEYVYDAAGTKLQQIITDGTSTTNEYINGYHYEAGSLTFFAHEEGRVVQETPGNFHYEYHLTDHLGNVRLTFGDLDEDGSINTSTEVLQTDHYYPFGMKMAGISSVQAATAQRYGYNGKELQDAFDLDWHDYGARMYDASIARWGGVDAMSEDYFAWSPFNYTLGNPIRFIDPDGNTVWVSTSGGQRLRYENGQLLNKDGSVYEGDDEFARRAQTDLTTAMANDDYAEVYGRLDESDVDYVIRFQGEDEGGVTGTLQTDGESVFINYTDPRGQSVEYGDDAVGFLAAETEHARQFEDGELGFKKTSGPGGSYWRPDDTYDIIDERKSHIFAVGVSGGDKTLLRRQHGTIERSVRNLKRDGIYETPIQNWENAGRPRDGVNHRPSATGKSETVKNGYDFHRRPSR